MTIKCNLFWAWWAIGLDGNESAVLDRVPTFTLLGQLILGTTDFLGRGIEKYKPAFSRWYSHGASDDITQLTF